MTNVRSWMLACLLVAGSLAAQANSGQDWVTPGKWQDATEGAKVGDGGVTTSTMGSIDYWVIWDGFWVGEEYFTQKLYRVRKDDPSLSAGETQRFTDAETNGTGVEVDVSDANEVSGVTALP